MNLLHCGGGVDESRQELRGIHEQVLATQEEVAAIADDTEVAIGMCQQLQHSVSNLQRHDDRDNEPPTLVRRADEILLFTAKSDRSQSLDYHRQNTGDAKSETYRDPSPVGGLGNSIQQDNASCKNFTAFRVAAHMANGGISRLSTTMFQSDQLETMADAMLASCRVVSNRSTALTGSAS